MAIYWWHKIVHNINPPISCFRNKEHLLLVNPFLSPLVFSCIKLTPLSAFIPHDPSSQMQPTSHVGQLLGDNSRLLPPLLDFGLPGEICLSTRVARPYLIFDGRGSQGTPWSFCIARFACAPQWSSGSDVIASPVLHVNSIAGKQWSG